MEKIIGFVGYECEDIAIYLARIMSEFGKRVAIIDRTEHGMLMEFFDMHQNQGQLVREGEVFGIWLTECGVNHENFDMVFYLFGYRLIHPKLYECEALIMVTDGVPAHASLLKKIGHWDRKQYLIIRNLVPMRHTEQYLAMLADSEKSYCEIPYDEQDIRMRYCMGIYTDYAVKRLSAGMKKALEILVCFLEVECQQKKIREIIRKI